jgi:uncharacterized protein
MMRFLVTGGIGFVGKHLCASLLNKGHRVTAVGLRTHQDFFRDDNFKYISADTREGGVWQEAVSDVDAVVNLAGKTIFKRWSKSYKELIYESRILTTRNLVDALPKKKELPFISTSAVGYYGNRGDDVLSEDSTAGEGFLSRVGIDWEAEAERATHKGARVVVARFGIVLGKDGGAMSKMLPAFRWFIGGPLGDGMQWFPWIHIDDVVSAIVFTVSDTIRGPVNFCAPNPVRNRDLAGTLGRVLKRPSFMPAPGFMIRLVMGELGGVLLSSQRAMPQKLLNSGFRFLYPGLTAALDQIISAG